MRALLTAVPLLLIVGCAGSTRWAEDEVGDGGFPRPREITLVPGSSQQIPLTLLATGSHSGTYDIAASSDDPAVATASVEPTSGDVDDDHPLDVLLTVTAAADAPPGDGVLVTVMGQKRGSDTGRAGTSVYVRIPE